MTSMPLERGFKYTANFIYNMPKLKNKRNTNPDWMTSLAMVEFIVGKMEHWGYSKTYFHDRDALPGGNIFTEFFTAVKESSFTIVIVTKGFIDDCWVTYKSQAAFKKLLDKGKSNRFIAVYVDLDDHNIPEELTSMITLTISAACITDPQRMDRWELEKLHKILDGASQPVQDTGPDRYPTPNPANHEPHNLGVVNRTSSHGALVQRNLTSGIQESNPPDLLAMRGDIRTDAPDSLDSSETSNQESATRQSPIRFNSQNPEGDNQDILTESSENRNILNQNPVGDNQDSITESSVNRNVLNQNPAGDNQDNVTASAISKNVINQNPGGDNLSILGFTLSGNGQGTFGNSSLNQSNQISDGGRSNRINTAQVKTSPPGRSVDFVFSDSSQLNIQQTVRPKDKNLTVTTNIDQHNSIPTVNNGRKATDRQNTKVIDPNTRENYDTAMHTQEEITSVRGLADGQDAEAGQSSTTQGISSNVNTNPKRVFDSYDLKDDDIPQSSLNQSDVEIDTADTRNNIKIGQATSSSFQRSLDRLGNTSTWSEDTSPDMAKDSVKSDQGRTSWMKMMTSIVKQKEERMNVVMHTLELIKNGIFKGDQSFS